MRPELATEASSEISMISARANRRIRRRGARRHDIPLVPSAASRSAAAEKNPRAPKYVLLQGATSSHLERPLIDA